MPGIQPLWPRTSRSNGPGFAVLAPAAERGRSAAMATLNRGNGMDAIQEKHERAVGDAFIDWYNTQMGTSFAYFTRAAEAPDLIYRDGTKELLLEITVAYYDAGHATMFWQNACDLPDAPDSWSSKGPGQKLVDSVNLALAKKSAKAYPAGCVLLVVVYPDLTATEEFASLMPEVRVPDGHPFAEIYVGGLFPASSSGSVGGYSWWTVCR
jgi:hypothetical protein